MYIIVNDVQTCILPIAPMATSGGIITGLAYVPPIWKYKKNHTMYYIIY